MAGTAVTAGLRRMVPLVIGTIGLLGCAAFVLALTYRHNLRLDLTAERRYTLSTHASKILAGLDADVRISAFVRSEDPRTPFLKDLLWRVAAETPRVSYEFVDLNRSPALARRYGVERYGALVVESGGRRRDIGNASEGLLLSAILAVTRASERTVYFVTGHGEGSLANTNRESGYSIASRTLEDEQFKVRELPLVGPDGVPSDATLVVSAGARKNYLAEEMSHLEAYLAGGGNLLLLLDPESPQSLAAMAARYGVRPLDQVVVDPAQRLAAGEGVTVLVSGMEPSFLVSGTLEAPPVFSYARALEVSGDLPATTVAFLRTGPSSFPVVLGADARAQPAGAVGALTVGVAVRLPGAETEGGESKRGGRLIVIGDSDFARNGMIDFLGNKDLLVNSVNWLARDETLLAARAQRKEPGREQFFVTEAQGAMAFWLAAIVQPALFFTAGAVVFVRRRLS